MLSYFRNVRAELLRPRELRTRRAAADVAFLPLGAFEFHGLPNPIGLDYLTVHHACCRAAELLGGGVSFPPLAWGLPHDSFMVDTAPGVIEKCAEAYGVTPDVVAGPHAHGGVDTQEQWLSYQRLIRMSLERIAAFGFRSIYVVGGHAPILHFIHPVCVAFSRAQKLAGQTVTTDFGSAWSAANRKVDHGGKIETSAVMAIDETLVDLTELEENPDFIGQGSGKNALEATTEFGEEFLEDCAKGLADEAKWLVENYPELPERHSHSRVPR